MPTTVPGSAIPSMPRKSTAPAVRCRRVTTSQATNTPSRPATGVAMSARIVVSMIASLPTPVKM